MHFYLQKQKSYIVSKRTIDLIQGSSAKAEILYSF